MSMKSTLKTMRRETQASITKEEERKKREKNTLANFFGSNKLYLKSAAEKAMLGPGHVQTKLE